MRCLLLVPIFLISFVDIGRYENITLRQIPKVILSKRGITESNVIKIMIFISGFSIVVVLLYLLYFVLSQRYSKTNVNYKNVLIHSVLIMVSYTFNKTVIILDIIRIGTVSYMSCNISNDPGYWTCYNACTSG